MGISRIGISVIVPVYKVGPYLRQCVDSILRQTYKSIEIILVDDGSPDDCGAVCDEYARKDSRIRVIHKPNGGLSDARNAGIDLARGEFIGFVDSDDWIDDDMFESMHALAIARRADISICGKYEVRDGHVILPPFSPADAQVSVCSRMEALKALTEDIRIDSHAWNKLFRRELFDSIRFPVGKLYEDIYVMHRLFDRAERIVVAWEPKYYYRVRTGSIVTSADYLSRIDLCDAFASRCDFLQESHPELAGTATSVWLRHVLTFYALPVNRNDTSDQRSRLGTFYTGCRSRIATASIGDMQRSERMLSRVLRYSPAACRMTAHFLHIVRAIPGFRDGAKRVFRRVRGISEPSVLPSLPVCEGKNRAFLIGMPEYNNLGDHAVAYAESRFFQNELPEYETVEISESAFRAGRRRIRHALRPGDIAVLPGGGNLGNQYPDQEAIRRWVIRHCRKNRVVVFPQTMYFTPDEAGKREAGKTAAIYNAHPDLILFAREKVSLEAMKRLFPRCRVALTPDIALSLRPEIPTVEREGVGICLRGDLESRVTPEEFTRITAACREYGGSVKHFDTCLADSIPAAQREAALRQIWGKFAGCRLVVTDRLHGVVFAAITGTPCVAVGNYNHKVRGICEWIADLGYIRFVDRAADIPDVLPSMPEGGTFPYDPGRLAPLFAPIGRLIRQPETGTDNE